MGSIVIVVSTPILQFFGRVRKAHEPVCVQAFSPEFAVEGLDEAVVCRLFGPGEVERYALGIGPEIQAAGDELAAIVDADRL